MAVTFIQNLGLNDTQTSTTTSNICEPSTAANGQQAFMTGNWFASSSTNGGVGWTFVNPFTRLPSAAGGFCCDQLVVYNPRHRIWIWLLQYSAGANGENIFRIAVSREATFGSWYWWDFAPRGVNAAWTGQWFDYPDMAFTDGNLFVTFNMFRGDTWQRATVFRFPLATLAAGTSLGYRVWSTTSNGSIRLCKGPGSTMFMGSHASASQLTVFQWPDAATGLTNSNVAVRPWSAGAYTATGPGGVNWLNRCDSRITGAWQGAGQIGFMWTANRDTTHPLPYVRVVRIRQAGLARIDEPDIWSRTSAWAYPAASANSQGVMGFTAFYGGGTFHPSHVVGFRTATGWDTAMSRSSTHSPPEQSWGDYLTCVAHNPNNLEWVASGYTLQGGTTRRHIEPRYVRFRA